MNCSTRMADPVPATATAPHTGYSELRAALDAAHGRMGVNKTVRVTMLGEDARSWDLVTGDHVERDGTLHLGGDIVVFPDSTAAGAREGLVRSCGGHIMGNGDTLARFTIDGVALNLEWNMAG